MKHLRLRLQRGDPMLDGADASSTSISSGDIPVIDVSSGDKEDI
jgi:hypothetical protein